MKKNLLLLLIAILYSFTTPEKATTVSGKIINAENKTIRIKGELFDKEIKLKPDGSFSENLGLESDHIYTIETTRNSFQIYLGKNSKLVINADDLNLSSTLKFTGNGNIENQYLAKKQLITSATPDRELYKLSENEFLKKLQEIKTSVNNLYSKTKFTNVSFKEKEAKSIYYLEQKHLYFYTKYHSKVSETYPKIDETINLDNDSDFLFSNEYQELALYKFYENVKADEDSFYVTAKNAIPKIKALKTQSIKNRLIERSASDVSIANTNYEKIYEEFLSITNDPLIKQKLTTNYNLTNALKPGKPSPTFNYENQKGGKTSLEDLKGKYIYIDFWATWCAPCVKEIPFLQKVEEQYKGKNIEFISISIDSMEDQPKWSKFVTEKQLGGIQLLAENEWNSKIIKDYGINGVPTFILLDPNGNIVNARAPKPSDPKLIELFNSLKI
ncbi:thiol-disulfide isomerase/thioredoxin [Flavobacterium nitrogenifigens]|uniref:Thiol-disulfide isomerase/thioredoxin n=2 Tax=Flavobacterium TaxID=237 RepID=A0A7W7IT08_9FLAO|nr:MULTISPECIES: TlpA disulfide reductase family protein [Flavobacterium]MBB4800003.1 thiol-disulfide isomerase/thioredoxin [Flavobacterium nitrogenifigens]MBB6386247.1 thiol-disulfide isomerase/thioredoxin [Flavobacterium notoginsengisoli]